MPLPPQVQAQLDRADALLAAQQAPAPQPAPQPAAEPAPPPVPAAPAPAAVAPVPPAPVPPAPANDAAQWEQRYRSLQGVHRTLQQQHAALQEQTQSLNQRLAALEAAASKPAPPTEPPKPTASPQDIQVFGEDMVSMVHRVAESYIGTARQMIAQEFAALRQEVDALKGTVQGTAETVQKTAEEVFFDNLTKLVPNWVAINEMPEWLAYMAEPDPIYGRPRQLALDEAHATGNAQRAANIFNAFIGQLPPAPASAPPASPTPRSAASAPPVAGPQKVFITQAEVNQFYDDVRRGKYRASPQLRDQREAEINLAMAEGRIV